ncbi:hypothetical protein VP1G_04673 [Cytospora mali]|uniref:Glycoside hydrolase 131 catalytic N-terminal domain-containing protein n=1 Tax=Cytospora mali TaxID=578113 RepID=A0A194V0I0_CYTMA|nr:hypothetical protein VP1G_04673 [Valsa mali var. pyri (nom. inval.)]
MIKQTALAALAAHLVALASAGTTVWDGSFNNLTTADLADWSWSNQVGEYQWYIHGDGETSEYIDFAASYANPADTLSTKGAKFTLDSTAYWEGQTMRRTELIPQVSDTSSISSGTLYYHFSLMREADDAPSVNREHQIAFFESHFTEMKYGWISGESGTSDNQLRWFANSESQWNTTMEAGVWHNCAYEIDFDGGSVAFWHSTGSDALTKVVSAVTASASSNGADWHVGVLELPRDGYTDTDENLYFSGVYIESGDITTEFSGSSASSGSTSGASSSAAVASSSAVVATSAAATSAAATSAAAISSAAAETSSAVVETSPAVAETSSAAAAATTSSAAAAAAAAASSSSSVAAVSTSAAASTSAAPATTLAASSSSSCVKRTKTVYVTMSA